MGHCVIHSWLALLRVSRRFGGVQRKAAVLASMRARSSWRRGPLRVSRVEMRRGRRSVAVLALAALSLGGPGLSAAAQSLQATASCPTPLWIPHVPHSVYGHDGPDIERDGGDAGGSSPSPVVLVGPGSGTSPNARVAKADAAAAPRPEATSALLSTSRARTPRDSRPPSPTVALNIYHQPGDVDVRAHQSALPERLARQPAVGTPRSCTGGFGGHFERRGHRLVVLQYVLHRRAYPCNGNHQGLPAADLDRAPTHGRIRTRLRPIATYFWSGCLDVVTAYEPASSAYAQLGPPKAFVTDPSGNHDTPPTFPDGTTDAFLDRFRRGRHLTHDRSTIPRSRRRPVLQFSTSVTRSPPTPPPQAVRPAESTPRRARADRARTHLHRLSCIRTARRTADCLLQGAGRRQPARTIRSRSLRRTPTSRR